MTARTISLFLIILLTGCVTVPNFETGDDCWRYGVAETNNTGPMTATPLDEIPVVKLDYEDLLIACDQTDDRTLAGYWRDKRTVSIRACFKPRPVDGKAGHDTIYLHRIYAGAYEINHEKCHALLGRKHNACSGYGIGKDESACNWDK